MARRTKTTLIFQVTIPDIQGLKIPEVRELIKNGIGIAITDKELDIDVNKVRIHLTNKEISYA